MPYAPNSLAARDVAYAMHPYTNLATHPERGPLVITRGDGIYVWDDEENRYIEGLAGLWCVSLGFSEQRLVDAATRQLGTLPYSHTFAHRSPNLPPHSTRALLVGAPTPTITASMAAVPLPVTMHTGEVVWNTYCRLSVTSRKIARCAELR